MMRALLARELRLAWRSGAEILNPLWFFLIVITLFPFGVGAAPQLLAQIAPGVVWVAALLAALLVMDRLFRDDWQDGSLEQLMLLPTPLVAVVLVKVVAHWMMSGLPLLIVSPLAALLLGMSLHDAGVLALTLLLGTPTLSFLGAVGVGLTVGLKRGGVLLSLLVLPLAVPLLIFATAACQAAAAGLPVSGYLAMLAAFLTASASMWKALHQLAIPERLYRLCGCWIPWLAALSALLLVIGLGWGFGFAPADYQQGESYRIMYLHVPAAMWSMGLYLAMAVAAFVGVVWQIKMADLAIAALAPVGAVCTLVALVSGAAWGKPMWGTWWIWDARLTSELVLLFLYAGVIALWHAFDDRRLAGRAAGILVLVGVVNLPIIHYSVYWWNTLHQGSTNLQQTIDPSMRLPLRICIFAFLMLSVTLTLMRLRNLILQLERRRPWVVALVNKGVAR